VRRRTTLRALAGAAALFAIVTSLAGARSNEQAADYRYTGAVENGVGIPTHLARAGEGFVFSFFDALSQGRRSEPYAACVGRPGKPPVKCWKLSARFGVGKVALGQMLPSKVPFGSLTVRWSVEGHRVATWRLFYARGIG
jgi:hypothetical protein